MLNIIGNCRFRISLVLLLIFSMPLLVGCGGEQKANLHFVDVKGEEIASGGTINIWDPIIIRLDNLLVNEFYRVRVLDPNGDRLYNEDLVYISDGDGELPDTPVAFLGSEERVIALSKPANPEGGAVGLQGFFREMSPGEWCVIVYRYRGGAVTERQCLNVSASNPMILTVDSEGSLNNSFLLNTADVYAWGQNFTPAQQVDLYVVDNSSQILSDGDELLDSRGESALSLTSDDAGSFVGLLWDNSTKLGVYDIVVDTDRNGLFGTGTDIVYSLGFPSGFAVQNRGISTLANRVELACGSIGSSYCTYKNFFTDEDVYVFLSSNSQPSLPFDVPSPKLYIVTHRDDWSPPGEGESEDKNLLENVFDAVIKFPVQVGSYAGGKLLAYPKELLEPGCYDVIVDTNNNQKFNFGNDFIDDTDEEGSLGCGFVVPGEEGAPAVTILTIRDGDDQDVSDEGETSSGTLQLQGTIDTEGTIASGFITVESGSQLTKLGFSPSDAFFDTGLFPLYKGENRITVYIMDSENKTGYARINVTSNKAEEVRAIEIELTWTKPEDATDSDLDLHLVNIGETYFDSSSSPPGDCYFVTCRPGSDIDWGETDNAADDPVLEIDCFEDCVRFERIFMREVASTLGDYDIYVDAFNGKGTPTVKVFINGAQVIGDLTPPCETLESLTGNDSWHVGHFTNDLSFVRDDVCDTAENFMAE